MKEEFKIPDIRADGSVSIPQSGSDSGEDEEEDPEIESHLDKLYGKNGLNDDDVDEDDDEDDGHSGEDDEEDDDVTTDEDIKAITNDVQIMSIILKRVFEDMIAKRSHIVNNHSKYTAI